MIAWWFYQSATQFDPDGWWKLVSQSSVGTAVIQIVALISDTLADELLRRTPRLESEP